MEEDKKSGRGGVRPGAGRPKGDGGNSKRSLYCSITELNLLRVVLHEYRSGNYDKTIKECILERNAEGKETDRKRMEGKEKYLKGLMNTKTAKENAPSVGGR